MPPVKQEQIAFSSNREGPFQLVDLLSREEISLDQYKRLIQEECKNLDAKIWYMTLLEETVQALQLAIKKLED